MNDKLDALNMKPLAERKKEVSLKIRSKMPADIYDSFRKDLGTDFLKFKVLAGMFGRELWDEFWGVYRDFMESQVDQLLTNIENKTPDKDKDLF